MCLSHFGLMLSLIHRSKIWAAIDDTVCECCMFQFCGAEIKDFVHLSAWSSFNPGTDKLFVNWFIWYLTHLHLPPRVVHWVLQASGRRNWGYWICQGKQHQCRNQLPWNNSVFYPGLCYVKNSNVMLNLDKGESPKSLVRLSLLKIKMKDLLRNG